MFESIVFYICAHDLTKKLRIGKITRTGQQASCADESLDIGNEP
jgi:hypothetical protein